MLISSAPTLPFSPVIFLTLLFVLAVSSGVFWILAVRSTSQRERVALSEWGRETGFRFRPADAPDVPPAFVKWTSTPADPMRPPACLSNGPTWLMQFQTAPRRQTVDVAYPISETAPSAAGATAAVSATVAPGEGAVWHVLVRQVEAAWKPTGLRPAANRQSVLDLFSLSSFPRLTDAERFVVYGSDSTAAATLANSITPALLPRDIGLLLHGNHVILDFSSRHFDTIEFNRMVALAEQVASHLLQ